MRCEGVYASTTPVSQASPKEETTTRMTPVAGRATTISGPVFDKAVTRLG